MKFYTFFFLLVFITQKTLSQEFRFYINGSNIEDSTFSDIKDGDLLRVVFFNKQTNYKFRIAQLSIILAPISSIDKNTTLINDTTEFIILNPSDIYTSSPTFTLDLVKELNILKHNNCNISFKVKKVLANTDEGSDWIYNNMQFKEVFFKRKTAISESRISNAGK